MSGAALLPFPESFVMRTMFQVPSTATRFTKADFGQWHRVICAALDRDALAGGSVELFASSFVSYGLDPLAVTEQQERGRRAHAAEFRTSATGTDSPPTPEQFAAALMYSQGIVPRKEVTLPAWQLRPTPRTSTR